MTTAGKYVMGMNVNGRRSQVQCVRNNFLDDLTTAIVMVENVNWTILCMQVLKEKAAYCQHKTPVKNTPGLRYSNSS